MKAVLQRIDKARVTVEGRLVGAVGRGVLVFLGVGRNDDGDDAELLCQKICTLRIFEDRTGRMNHSLLDISGEMLVVSQFTLFADTKRGRRPSFTDACEPERAKELYDCFVRCARARLTSVATGAFQELMKVELVNDGPVTIILDTETMRKGTPGNGHP